VLNNAKLYGYFPDVEKLLDEARSEFNAGGYEEAINHAEECKRLIREWKEKAKPDIEVDMPLKEYRTKFILKNKGDEHARSVEMELSDVVSAELIDKVDLNAGEEKELSVILKPNEKREVPLKVKLRYRDLKGREYESERVFLINVSDAEREERGEKNHQ